MLIYIRIVGMLVAVDDITAATYQQGVVGMVKWTQTIIYISISHNYRLVPSSLNSKQTKSI
jgi:hypothetical protein